MKWFRTYTDIIDDEKIASISATTFQIFMFLMAFCCQNEHQSGLIPDEKILSWRFRMRENKIKKAINELELQGMVQRSNGAIIITNWNKRQFKSDDINARVDKFRTVTKDKNETLHETLHVTPQNRTDTEQIQNRTDKENTISGSKADKLKKQIHADKEKFSFAWKENFEFYKTKYPALDLKFQFDNVMDWVNREPAKAHKSAKGDLNLFFQRWLNKEKPNFKSPGKGYPAHIVTNDEIIAATAQRNRERIAELPEIIGRQKELLEQYQEAMKGEGIDPPSMRRMEGLPETINRLEKELAELQGEGGK